MRTRAGWTEQRGYTTVIGTTIGGKEGHASPHAAGRRHALADEPGKRVVLHRGRRDPCAQTPTHSPLPTPHYPFRYSISTTFRTYCSSESCSTISGGYATRERN